jgi:hypothetical protein
MANDEAINHSTPAQSKHPEGLADGRDRDSGNGDDLEHWLRVEDLLRQRRSNLLDFGLPAGLADRPSR